MPISSWTFVCVSLVCGDGIQNRGTSKVLGASSIGCGTSVVMPLAPDRQIEMVNYWKNTGIGFPVWDSAHDTRNKHTRQTAC